MIAGNPPREPALDRPDRVDAISDFLAPTIDDILSRIEGDEFTTTEFIALLQSDPDANAAYLEALRRWGEGERSAKMVVHGQVIPESCAGQTWLSGSDLPMAKTTHTRCRGGGASAAWTAYDRTRSASGTLIRNDISIYSGWMRIVSAKIG